MNKSHSSMFADSNLTIIENKFCSFDKCFYICNPKTKQWCFGRAVRHRSAKPATAVRFR